VPGLHRPRRLVPEQIRLIGLVRSRLCEVLQIPVWRRAAPPPSSGGISSWREYGETLFWRSIRQDRAVAQVGAGAGSTCTDAVELDTVCRAWAIESVGLGVRVAVVLLWLASLRSTEMLAKEVWAYDKSFWDCLAWDERSGMLKVYMNRPGGTSGEGRAGVSGTQSLVPLSRAAV
jgi:hypothetical protein